MAREDRFGRGSDHSSFTANGFPAAVFREANENYFRQHSAEDKVEGVDFTYLAQNARVNVAGAASVALRPTGAERHDRSRPAASRARGERIRRDAPVGRVTGRGGLPRVLAQCMDQRLGACAGRRRGDAVRLPNVSIDDYVFGVAAVGADGNESLVSAYVSPVRRMSEVKLVP